jgi:small-conductance mechanosensitive channel
VVLFALLVFLLRRAFRWLDAKLERWYQLRVAHLHAETRTIVQAERARGMLHAVLRTGRRVIVVVLALVLINAVLSLFPWTRALAQTVFALVLDPLRSMGNGIVAAVPGLMFIVVLIVVTRYALKVLRLLFSGIEHGSVVFAGFERDWAAPTYRIVRLLVIAFALVVAYPYIPGSDSAAFKGISLFLGVIFSLGSTSVIGNFIAGYTMTYRRVFRVGDRVKINEHIGDVLEMRLLVTHLRTPKNEEVVIPNSLIINSHVVNYSRLAREQGLILHTTVGIGYETPWRQVEAMLTEAAARTPGLRQEPAPFVLQRALGDFCVTYELNVYCENPQRMLEFYSVLHQNILDVFNEYDVQIMTPAYVADPAQPKVVPKAQWFAAPAVPGKDGART